MKFHDTKSAEIIFSVEVENTSVDVVSGSVGTVVYKKASVSNPSFHFALNGASVVGTDGSIKSVTGIVWVPTTGYFGVVYSSPAVGDRVTFSGAFTKPAGSARQVGVTLNVKPISEESSVSNGLSYDLDMAQYPSISDLTTK